MAKLVGTELPDDLLARLGGARLEEYADKVILITTIDDGGWPHPAMLSYFEVVAKDARNLRLAAYSESGTTRSMRERGKATLLIIDERLAYYVKGSATELRREMKSSPHNSSLNLRVEQVLKDEVNEEYEPGAYVSSGVRYQNPNRAAEMEKAERILAELLEERGGES